MLGPQFGAHGLAPADLAVAFVSGAAAESGDDRLHTSRRRVGVRGCRGIGLADMVRNDTVGVTEVDPRGDAGHLRRPAADRASPADSVALSRLYFL